MRTTCVRRIASRFCQLLQLSKSFGPGYRPERSAPGGTFEKLSNRNKKPGVERRANPPANKRASGFARCSTEYYPVFVTGLTSSPRGLDETHRPYDSSTSRTGEV